MKKNEIKNALYKEKPIAKRTARQTKENTLTDVDPYDRYITCLQNGETAVFIIPHNEQGENLFNETEPAQLLIRWLC